MGRVSGFVILGSWLLAASWGALPAHSQVPATSADEQPASESRFRLTDLDQLKEFRQRMHQWDRVVRGFRRAHHFAFEAGWDQGLWTGHVKSKEQGFEMQTTLPSFQVEYSFHLPLYRSLGYYVGSRSRVFYWEQSQSQEFDSARLYGLPSAAAGLIWNLTPAFRLGGGVDAALLRIEGFRSPAVSNPVEVSATAEVVSYQAYFDFFFDLALGLRVRHETYELKYDGANSVRLRRRGKTWSAGLIWHLI
jgi:hypothetical protein